MLPTEKLTMNPRELKSKLENSNFLKKMYNKIGISVKAIISAIKTIITPNDISIAFNAIIRFFCFTASSSLDKTALDKPNVASKVVKKR